MRLTAIALAALAIASMYTPSPGLAAPVDHSKHQEIIYYDAPDENGRLDGGSILGTTVPRSELRLQSPTWAYSSSKRVNGPVANRVDLVFVGDGYLATQLALYQTHVAAGQNALFALEPFATYENFFNVHVVEVISNEAGVDNDPTQGILRDTALDMGFFCSGIERLLCVNTTKAYSYANNAPDVDQVFAVANSTKYGGAGYTTSELATYSGGNASSPQVAIHELGHSLGDLADEYFSPGTYIGPEPTEVNASKLTAAQMVTAGTKWTNWMYGSFPPFDGPVNTYLGAAYYSNGLYRPTNNSMMRSLGRPFNPPSAESLIIEIYRIVSPIDDATPAGFVAPTETLFVTPLHPVGQVLDVEWFVDGAPVVGTTTETLDISTLGLGEGLHDISVTVTDNTAWVRNEAARSAYMSDSRAWQTYVAPAPIDVAVSCAADLPLQIMVSPDGLGDPLTAAQVWDGVPGNAPTRVDATVTVTLTRDGAPVVGLAPEQIQLVPGTEAWSFCAGAAIADAPTDATGSTTFTGPFFAGGHSTPGDLVEVVVSGEIVGSTTYPDGVAGLDLRVNSPDIDGDLLVDLADVGNFASDYNAYGLRSDLVWDGLVNLVDVGAFSLSYGKSCTLAKERARPAMASGGSIGLSVDRAGIQRSARLKTGLSLPLHLVLTGERAEKGIRAWQAALVVSDNLKIERIELTQPSIDLSHGNELVVGTSPRQAKRGEPLLLATVHVSVIDDAPARIELRDDGSEGPAVSDGVDVLHVAPGLAVTLNDSPRSANSATALSVQTHPNPFNPATQVAFTAPRGARVAVRAYDLRGRVAASLFEGVGTGTEQTATWRAEDMPSGVYFVRVESEGESVIEKVLLLK